ncbi:MAG TPA: AAA family ATPase [Kofleriaceae bacterium]|nr:AAA family ATPase [Kofleriaceae bacterium]
MDESALPHNLDAEQSILGGILLQPAVLRDLAELTPDDFFDLRNKVVFAAMRALEAAGKPIDVVTVELEIEKFDRTYETNKLDAIGGVGYLGVLAGRCPTANNVVEYAETVRLLHRHRQAQVALISALDRARTWPHDPFELLSELAGELQRLDADLGGTGAAARAKKNRWTVPLLDYLGDEEPDDDDREDWIIRDLIPRGEPFLWGGPMKGGKTWAALDLCIVAALGLPWLRFENTLGKPVRVLGLFLEDNKRRLRKRLWELCRAHGVTPNNELLRENLCISRAPLRLPDASDQRRLAAEIKAFGAQVVVADNLTRVMVGDPISTRDAAAFTRVWTELGDETGASIGFLHHTKKPVGDQKAVDPFDTLRGSGDFGAAARNIIVTTPLRSESTAKLSEVRMRGNLDLRCESFMLGFERKEMLGRWHARLTDRGEIEEVKEEVRKDVRAAKEAKKRDELAAENERRRNMALQIARTEGFVTQKKLAEAFGLRSPRAVADVLEQLVRSGVFRDAGKRGYEFADADRQEGLL